MDEALLERVLKYIFRYNMFEPGQRVGVAVSGGADSVCLLHVLRELAPRWALTLSVLHLNHGLRGPESRADAEFVQQLAARLGLTAFIEEADVQAQADQARENLEQCARQARREFFLRFLKAGRLDRIALGHTRSDQAETVLYRFLRGSGTTGLAGILPKTQEGLVRPLLGVSRTQVLDYLVRRGLAWREDSSNQDLRFQRNLVRHQLLPQLTREWNPGLPEILADVAAVARDEEDYWEQEISRIQEGYFLRQGPALIFDCRKLAALPVAVARRLLRRAVEAVKGDLRSVNFRHIEGLLEMARSEEGHERVQIPGVDALRSFDWIRLAPAGWDHQRATAAYRIRLAAPGSFPIPGQDSELRLELIDKTEELCHSDLAFDLLSGGLALRSWQPGDRYRPARLETEEKLKGLFQRFRIPFWERRGWPIITAGETIVWTRCFGPAAGLAASASTGRVLRIHDSWNQSTCAKRLNS